MSCVRYWQFGWHSTGNLKGLSEHGGRADFSKNLRAPLFNIMKTYRMNLITAGYISLDSKFKYGNRQPCTK
jgi:hypothetical protein